MPPQLLPLPVLLLLVGVQLGVQQFKVETCSCSELLIQQAVRIRWHDTPFACFPHPAASVASELGCPITRAAEEVQFGQLTDAAAASQQQSAASSSSSSSGGSQLSQLWQRHTMALSGLTAEALLVPGEPAERGEPCLKLSCPALHILQCFEQGRLFGKFEAAEVGEQVPACSGWLLGWRSGC